MQKDENWCCARRGIRQLVGVNVGDELMIYDTLLGLHGTILRRIGCIVCTVCSLFVLRGHARSKARLVFWSKKRTCVGMDVDDVALYVICNLPMLHLFHGFVRIE